MLGTYANGWYRMDNIAINMNKVTSIHHENLMSISRIKFRTETSFETINYEDSVVIQEFNELIEILQNDETLTKYAQ